MELPVIGNASTLERKMECVRRGGGLSTLQVITDFDMTLTKFFVNGRRGENSHSLLNLQNPEYVLKQQQLDDHYGRLELSPNIPFPEKTKLMEEWWDNTFALLIEGGLTRRLIVESVANSVIGFRDGVDCMFQFLEENSVPVLIFSAGFSDIIEEVMLQKLGRKFDNVTILSNRMVFDHDGNLRGFKGRTIHSLNKYEHAMASNMLKESADGFAAVRRRKNVLLLGDRLADLEMSSGLDYENRISVGFLQSYSAANRRLQLREISNRSIERTITHLTKQQDTTW